MRKLLRIIAASVALCIGVAAAQQDGKPPAQQQKPQDAYFSGNVVSYTADKITVTRRTLSLTSVTRSFFIDANTQIDGKLQAKARVTVSFEKTASGDRAIRILVR